MVQMKDSLMAQMVKNLPTMQETRVWFLGWKTSWRREWLPTPVFLPGEFHGQRSLLGHSPWGRKESDTTEQLTQLRIWRNRADEPIFRAGIDMQMWRTDTWTQGWKETMGPTGRWGLIYIYIPPRVKYITNGKLLYSTGSTAWSLWWPRRMAVGGWRKAQKGGDMCIHIADLHNCTAETSSTWYRNYTPIKIKF